MFLQGLVVFLVFLSASSSSLHHERRQLIERVRKHLGKAGASSRTFQTANWLENSHKIGLGYNILSGSPVCYTGECQMAGFTHSIFKLNYTSSIPGSCTDKLVPNNVELDCLPGALMKIDSEIIDTVEQLHKSISNKVQISGGISYMGVGFSYKYSKETRYMLDNIVKNHQTSIFTTVHTSYAKLSMFEMKMELSDNFKYVIENLPCCEEDDSDIEEYIKDFIFDYFGITYVTTILLGGVAQQNIFIDREAKERLEKQDISITHEAKLKFDIYKVAGEAGTSITDQQETSKTNRFYKEIRSMHSTTLGGDPHLNTILDWSKTVSNNPVIVQFTLRDINRLFTKGYFPDDPLITNKSQLIKKVLEKYISNSTYCYKNCGGNGIRGTCEPTGYFQFGICKCKPGWTGVDCEIPIKEPSKILHGTICGFDRSFMRVNCGGLRPWTECPKGWAQHVWSTDLTVCYKSQTEIGDPVHGTLCGLHSYQYGPHPFTLDINCKTTTNVLTGVCPLGYQKRTGQSSFSNSGRSGGNGKYGHRNSVCIIVDGKEHLPGTLCGMQVEDTINGPSCGTFNPGLRQCPPEYFPRRTAFNDLGFMVCVKN